MYGLTLILTLAVVGGVIAYIGDRLGMKVGRKKLTLFGLRPKHTSIVVTIVTGVFIATASIVVLTIVSQDVRTALFRMKEIQEELAAVQLSYDEMRLQRDNAQLELEEAQTSLASAVEAYNQVMDDLQEAQAAVEEQRLRIAENQEIIAGMSTQITELELEASRLMAEIEELWGYRLAFGQMRGANIAFNASEVISSVVIEPGQSRAAIRNALDGFLNTVDDIAYRRGARSTDGDYRAIYLRPGVVDFAVEELYTADTARIIRAVSESNTIPGIPVVAYLEIYPDQLVYAKHTVLVERVWNPMRDSEIDRVILDMLNQANVQAINLGMAVNEDLEAVLLPGSAFLEALFVARDIKEPVTIRLVVAEDTWRSDTPIHIELQIIR
jgi:multidrug efflux pump subunit AcrA (membrane-fusion protein)